MELEVDAFNEAMAKIEYNEAEGFETAMEEETLTEGDVMENSGIVQEHVSAALALIPPQDGPGTIAERMHAALWPYVVIAAAAVGAPAEQTVPGATDKRAKQWQYVVRFWRNAAPDEDPELIGETDPAIATSTGALPKIITDLAAEMHDNADIEALSLESLKALLPQFRNNLGRGNNATMRIPYEDAGVAYRCQVDVFRLNGE